MRIPWTAAVAAVLLLGLSACSGTSSSSDTKCTDATTCPVPSNVCLAATCTGGQCGEAPKVAGTKISDPTPGDCKSNQCDGAGNLAAVNDNTDLPSASGDCATPTCMAGMPGEQFKAAGTACASGGGVFCDGAGVCVQCIADPDCVSGYCSAARTCQVPSCVDGVKNGAETAVDCGGGACPSCATGKNCTANGDCSSGACVGNVCAAPRVASDDLVGGTRLRAKWYMGPDGNLFPPTWWEAPFFDQLRGVDCLPRVAADGELRCLPEQGVLSPVGSQGHPWAWADAGCSEGVVSLFDCQTVPDAMGVLDDSTCPARIQLRARGSQVAVASPLYVRDATGTCIQRGSAGGATYRLGPEVPASQFVSALQVDGETRGGFTEVVLQWEDGARQARGLRPDGQGQYGWPARAADGAMRLLPTQTDADLLWFFSDSTCSAPAAVSTGSSCSAAGPTLLGYFRDVATCEERSKVSQVGSRIPQAYEGWGNCQPVTAPGLSFWEVGAELPPASFPTVVAQASTDRLGPPRFAVGGGWSWRGGWAVAQAVDHAMGVDATPLLAADGQERWLPSSTAASSWATQDSSATWYFSDPTCTLQVHSVNLPANCPVTSPYIDIYEGSSCARTRRIFELGAQAIGTIYVRVGPAGSCNPLGSSGRYHRLGAEVPAASFAPVTRILR